MADKKTDNELIEEQIMTLPDFCGDLLIGRATERSLNTRLGYARDLNLFFDYIQKTYFKDKNKTEITGEDLIFFTPKLMDKFINHYESDHAPRTVARMRTSVSVMFKYLADTLKVLPYNPVAGAAKVQIPQKLYVEYLTFEEQEKLLDVIKTGAGMSKMQLAKNENSRKRDIALIFLFLDTGLRLSEVVTLNIENLDLQRCCLTRVRRKGNELCEIYFSDQEKEYLEDYLNERELSIKYSSLPSDALFINPFGERLSPRGIEKMVKKYMQIALPNRKEITVHKLRSSFAMTFYEKEKDVLALSQLLNHKSLNTTQIYAKAASNTSMMVRGWRNK